MKSRWIKLCSILLVLTMLINTLPVHALALDSEDRGSASVQGDTERLSVKSKVSERKASSTSGYRTEALLPYPTACRSTSRTAAGSGSTLTTDCLWRRALTERPKSMPKGSFVVMKTGRHPMRTKLKLFYKWGIQFEKQLEMPNRGNRPVYYAGRAELEGSILQAFPLMLTMPPPPVVPSNEDATMKQMPSNASLNTE